VAGEDAESDGHAGVDGDLGQALGDALAHVVEVGCAAPDDDAEGDDRVVAASGEDPGDDGEFPAAGDPEQGRLVDAEVVQGAQGAVDQSVHHLLVPLRGDDGDPQVPHVAYGQFRCTLAAHVSPRWFAYWLPQAGTVGVSSQGRSWPIRSRLVRR